VKIRKVFEYLVRIIGSILIGLLILLMIPVAIVISMIYDFL